MAWPFSDNPGAGGARVFASFEPARQDGENTKTRLYSDGPQEKGAVVPEVWRPFRAKRRSKIDQSLCPQQSTQVGPITKRPI